MDSGVVAELRGIVKVYPDGVRALDGVDLKLHKGMVHAVLGENGAGKTTLMRILYGEIKPSRGEIIIDGVRVRFRGTIDAIRHGVSMVYQHPRMVPSLTVLDNMRLYFHSAGINVGEALDRLRWAMELTGFSVDLNEVAGNLSLGVLQRAEILRNLAGNARILILDEPTTNLTPLEVKGLFNAVRRMRDAGLAIVYITHRLPEVMEIADVVTVLRRGRVVKSMIDPKRIDPNTLAKLMVGELPSMHGRGLRRRGRDPLLSIRGLRARGRVTISIEELDLYPGEVLAIAGVEGNGQDELVSTILGFMKPDSGSIRVLGKNNPDPIEFFKGGGGFIPGDRVKALIQGFSVAENLAFLVYTHGGPRLLTPGRLIELYERVAGEYRVVSEGPWSPVSSLSGGNQQKLLVGSQLYLKPRLLLAVNPTRGLDVATTRYVRGLIDDVASSGGGVLLVSSDLDEVMELADRIAVLYKGRVTGVVERDRATPELLGRLMGGM